MVIATKYDGDDYEPDSESCWSDALCRLRPPCLSSRSHCRSCSTRSEEDYDDEEGDFDDDDKDHLVGLDQ